MKKDKNCGFSLIELIIVVAIMAVLVALIAANLTKNLNKSKRSTDLHNAGELAEMIQTCITDYEAAQGEFIAAGGSAINLSWTGKNVSGGPTSFNTMLDGMVTRDPISEETGAIATANIALKGATSNSGYKIVVTIGNASVTK